MDGMKKFTGALLSLALSVSVQAKGSPEDLMNGIDLRVLSYNINGLPAPLKKGKEPHYARIAEVLQQRRIEGTQPHIVLIQEAFDGKSDILADTTGYKYVLKGPGRKDGNKRGRAHWAQKTRKAYASFSDPQKFMGSGLLILSDFPIIEARHKAFAADECAGFDCLSNKSILLARIEVPGMDSPLDIVNSHFNSRRSAKAPKKAVLKAHNRQTDALKWFLDKTDVGNPTIVAGDFNTKQDIRYRYFKDTIGFQDAGVVCLGDGDRCAVADGTQSDDILFKTNDKHFFENGDTVQVIPRRMERNFDELLNGKPLSDHLGYEVVYLLSSE